VYLTIEIPDGCEPEVLRFLGYEEATWYRGDGMVVSFKRPEDGPADTYSFRLIAIDYPQRDGLCHEITVAGDCGFKKNHSGNHDWQR
jgi:hypothetical protein